jgi:hypothetical protein
MVLEKKMMQEYIVEDLMQPQVSNYRFQYILSLIFSLTIQYVVLNCREVLFRLHSLLFLFYNPF